MKRSALPTAGLFLLALGVSAMSAGGPTTARADSRPASISDRPTPDSIDHLLPPGGRFFDDDETDYEGYLEALAAFGAIAPCDPSVPDLICPDRDVTGLELAAMLHGTGCGSVRCEAPPPGRPDAYRWLVAGLADACAGTRAPSDCYSAPLSRGAAAGLLARFLALPPAAASTFADAASSTFADGISRAEAAGIITGCGLEGHDFCPDAVLTLGEAALFVGRALALEPLTPQPRPSFVLAATGDILIHLRVSARAVTRVPDAEGRYDYFPMLRRVQGLIESADLALCHLEVPLSPDSRNLSGYPRFNAPREVADALARVGYEGCSTASNHSLDRGFTGLAETLDVLDTVGLRHTGTARTEAEAATARLYTAGTATVGHLSYTYGMNGLRPPRDATWSVNRIEAAAILEEAARVRAAGADFVVVSLHWGAEYTISPTRSQQALAAELLASDDIDLIVGHHAHVVQPLGRIGDEYVAYGLGNFLSGQCCNPPNTRDGVIAFFEIARRSEERWTVRSVEFTPTWVNRYGDYHVYAIPEALEDPQVSDSFKRVLAASQERTVRSLGRLGEEITVGAPVARSPLGNG